MKGVTGVYKRLKGVTEGYKSLQGFTGCCKGLQGVTGAHKELQGGYNKKLGNYASLTQLILYKADFF